MKRFSFLLAFSLFAFAASAQTPPVDPKLDSLAKRAQRLINNNQPDSLYAMMGDAFKQQISPDKMKEVTAGISGQLGKWTEMESRGVQDGVARYKATFALAPLDFYISQDKQGKIATFLFKPLE